MKKISLCGQRNKQTMPPKATATAPDASKKNESPKRQYIKKSVKPENDLFGAVRAEDKKISEVEENVNIY